ncbi:hypothetical protein ACSBR2_001278 [Camellia fascicularis]
MYYNGPMTFLQLKLAWVLLGAAFASAAVAQTLPGCEDRCGNISIPYPFGTTEGCYIQQHFKVACNDTDYHPPKLFLESSDTNVEITEILLSGELRISAWIGFDCFSEGGVQYQNNTFETWIRVPEFPISNTRNKFTAVGCDTYAVIKGSLGRKYATGCLSLCDTIDSVINGSCSGIGCCQTSIPKGVKNYHITLSSYNNHTTETATALSYLHSAASTPIIHRDVKTANILLDDNYVAKVSDFGSSRLTPIDQIQLATLVQGTHGYLDPESLQTSQLTEKSDVYSFGVVLVELLTGKEAISFDRCAAERNLAMYFILAMKEDRLFEIVDEQVKNEAKADQLKEFAILAKGCLRGQP